VMVGGVLFIFVLGVIVALFPKGKKPEGGGIGSSQSCGDKKEGVSGGGGRFHKKGLWAGGGGGSNSESTT